MNSVTAADYQNPLQIASFMNDLDSGFRLLNLKNDSLRKRFDSIKYDMKKVEEVKCTITLPILVDQYICLFFIAPKKVRPATGSAVCHLFCQLHCQSVTL